MAESTKAGGAPSLEKGGAHALDIVGVTHRYGKTVAVDDIDLSIDPGEMLALLGPSGCGKTTLLRIVAGFVRASAGQVLVDGWSIDDVPASGRRIGIVFQNYALFPHLTVRKNIAYGLQARRASRDTVAEAVKQMLALARLDGLADRYPRELSGGQQQRVALARALAIRPQILLLDEPLGALDKNLRLDMQLEVRRIQRELNITTVLITHDQDEAMSMADRIAVMRGGRIEQIASPTEIYDKPASLFVAGFIGTANQLSGVVISTDNSKVRIRLSAGAELAVDPSQVFRVGERVVMSVRPEHLVLSTAQSAECFPVELRASVPLGPTIVHEAIVAGGASLKISETRTRAAGVPLGPCYCSPARDAHIAVFSADNESLPASP